jgi:hypothetical protein
MLAPLVNSIKSRFKHSTGTFNEHEITQGFHAIRDVRQTEIHTAEPLVPEPSAFAIEVSVQNLRRHKSPVIGQIPADMIKARSRTILSYIHKLITSIWNKKELPQEWKESIIAPIFKKGDTTRL